MIQPVFTEKTKCRDCYKCVRNCPVKAIKVEKNSARIIHELCIFCGRCVHICPADAKKVRNDVERVKNAIRTGRRVFLSIAPSWSSGFLGSKDEMIGKLRSLGFAGISETALGAQVVSQNISEKMKELNALLVSSACPCIVELFKKYHPDLMSSLCDLHSPLGVHSIMLKQHYGDDSVVVFAGPCIAKKLEADSNDSPVDFALTFDEIFEWVAEESEVEDCRNTSDNFVPFSADNSTLYAHEGGMVHSLKSCGAESHMPMISLSGLSHVLDALNGVSASDNIMLELLSCPGGCVNGSGFNSSSNQFSFRKKSLEYFFSRKAVASYNSLSSNHPPRLDEITTVYKGQESDLLRSVSDDNINTALIELGKINDEDLLDCSGCGYNSCRDFAIAYLQGMGEKQMCVTNMRKRAQRKVDMLLKTLPMGVVIVNRHMKIAECNAEFVRQFSEMNFDPDEESLQKIADMPISRFIDITLHLNRILSGEQNLFQERIKYRDSFMRVSFFSIEKKNLAGVIFQDITSTSMKREIVIKKAEEVINKNLQNVQQIASLLGENAAETEIILRSLTDEFHFSAPQVI